MNLRELKTHLSKKSPNKIKHFTYFLCLVIGLVTVYHIYYAKRLVPGVEISGLKMGGMTYNQAKDTLENKLQSEKRDIKISYEDQTYSISDEELFIEYNVEATIIRAFEIGRTGNIIVDTKDKIAGIFKPLRLRNFYTFEDSDLDNLLATIEGELNLAPVNSQYTYSNRELAITQANGGKRVDIDSLYKNLIDGLDVMDFSEKKISIENVPPVVVEEDLIKHKDAVQKIIESPLTLVLDDRKWVLSSDQILSFLRVKPTDSDESSIVLNNPTFESYAELIAQEVNQLPRGKVTSITDGKVEGFEITQEGNELDINTLRELLEVALFNGKHEVSLPMRKIDAPNIKEKYGIVALIGEGDSVYTGSASGRVHNLSLAAERISGVLVPPDTVFSFNNAVGEISGKTGYTSAYVISNGRTVLGDGGGVCQTSTTLFRAVLNSGLPVVKRNPHAYRVRYYELDRPVGFDAAIYQPSLDFQFKNDTEDYILIQAVADKENSKLKFQLFGTPDGRSTEISEPVVSNQTPPPADLYQDDPTLAKGVVKQVDFAAWGATSSFNRIVKRDGRTIYDDTFTTRYQPWRAIYLVGTKE